MTWSVYADPYTAGELGAPVKTQQITFHGNLQVRAVRTWIILNGNPTYSNLKMKIYDHDKNGDAPSRSVKAQSTNVWNPSDLLKTQPYGYKEIYFEFIPFGVNGNDKYHIALEADSYSPTSNSFIAWSNVWPNPVYDKNFTVTGSNFLNSPYMISAVVGSRD